MNEEKAIYSTHVNWKEVLINVKLSEEFIEKNIEFIAPGKNNRNMWHRICATQTLTESFIEKYQNKVDWFVISSCQKLSENFIEKYKDKVSWFGVSLFQNLSEEFIRKHFDKLNLIKIMENTNVSNEIKEEIKLLKEII